MISLAATTLKLNCEIHKTSAGNLSTAQMLTVMALNSPQDRRWKGISWV